MRNKSNNYICSNLLNCVNPFIDYFSFYQFKKIVIIKMLRKNNLHSNPPFIASSLYSCLLAKGHLMHLQDRIVSTLYSTCGSTTGHYPNLKVVHLLRDDFSERGVPHSSKTTFGCLFLFSALSGYQIKRRCKNAKY